MLERTPAHEAAAKAESPSKVYINGRFLSATPTGVQRTARELVHALDRLAPEAEDLSFRLLRPQATTPLTLGHIEQVSLPAGGQAFEQVALPRRAADGLLLCLANSGPVLGGGVVLMIHDMQTRTSPQSYSAPFRLWYRVMQPRVARRARRVLTVSAYSAEQLRASGIVRGPVDVVPNGGDHILREAADEAALGRLGLEPGGYVLALSTPQVHKNIRVLEAAAAENGVPPLVLVGLDPERSQGNVRGVGRVEDSALRALYANALCFALPSLTEGFGLPLVEAMSCGCPCVAARAGALPEVAGEAALLLPPLDSSVWAASFRRLASDEGERRRLAAAGHERAARFTWEEAGRRLLASLRRTVSQELA